MVTTAYPQVGNRDSFTTVEVARLLKISRTTLLKYNKLGFIRSHIDRMGRKRYTGAAIKKFYDSLLQGDCEN